MGDGELFGVSGNLLLLGVVVASLELGVEMKAGYIIVVDSSSSSSSCLSKELLVVVTSLTSPFLLLLLPSPSTSSFRLLPSGILFLPRRPGFLPSRLPAPEKILNPISHFPPPCLLSSLAMLGKSLPTGSRPRPRSTFKDIHDQTKVSSRCFFFFSGTFPH